MGKAGHSISLFCKKMNQQDAFPVKHSAQPRPHICAGPRGPLNQGLTSGHGSARQRSSETTQEGKVSYSYYKGFYYH